MNKVQLRQLLDVIMCADIDCDELKEFADSEVQQHGFDDWVDAYHNME